MRNHPRLFDRFTLGALGLLTLAACADETTAPTFPFSLEVTPRAGSTATNFECKAGGGADHANSVVRVRWDFESDGTWDTDWAIEKSVTHRFATAGHKTIRVEAELVGGASGAATLEVDVLAAGWWNGFAPPPNGLGLNDQSVIVGEWNGSIIVGGAFTEAGGVAANHIASWDGAVWSPLGAGMNNGVIALGTYHGDLIATGSFTQAGGVPATRIARWDGASWSAMGDGFNVAPYAFAVLRDTLFAGGPFTMTGADSVDFVAKWDGTRWRSVHTGFKDDVYALAVWRGQLIAGGALNASQFQGSLAAYDGSRWTYIPGLNNSAYAMTIWNDELVVGGFFLTANGATVNRIARWDGVTWRGFGEGLSDWVTAVTLYNGDVVACGKFVVAGTEQVSHIARWNGTRWLPFGSGLSGLADTMPWWMLSLNGKLYVAGAFITAGGIPSSYFARWED